MKNGLQGVHKSVKELTQQKKVTASDVEHLTDAQHKEFTDWVTKRLDELEDDKKEQNKFIANHLEAFSKGTKQSIWHYNHQTILNAIHNCIVRTGNMPTINFLTEETKLSRTTINKHLKDYRTHELNESTKTNLAMLRSNVLASVYMLAMSNDIKAMKLFLEQTQEVKPNRVGQYVEAQQNNYNIPLLNIDPLSPE